MTQVGGLGRMLCVAHVDLATNSKRSDVAIVPYPELEIDARPAPYCKQSAELRIIECWEFSVGSWVFSGAVFPILSEKRLVTPIPHSRLAMVPPGTNVGITRYCRRVSLPFLTKSRTCREILRAKLAGSSE